MMVENCNGRLIITLNLSKIAQQIFIPFAIPPSTTIQLL